MSKSSSQLADLRYNMVQVIENNGNKWHMIINGVDCVFIPLSLFVGNNLFPTKPNVEKGLRWRVNRKWVSYKQIKNAIINKSS